MKKSTNTLFTIAGPNAHVLGLHQKMLQADGWKGFLSNSDNKNHLIALLVKFLRSPESEECGKYIV